MILIKVKNPKLLNCVKDYCDENLLHELETVECSYDELTRVLLQHDQAIAITDGTVFYDHVDEDFLQHIPDLDFCKQLVQVLLLFTIRMVQILENYLLVNNVCSSS